MVVVADGAPWIWNIAQDRLPGAIPIVDRFHVKQTLHRTAQAIFGSTVEQAKQWATARCLELDNGKLSAVVRALRPHAGDCADAARCRLYIYRNRRRMRYPQFHKQGLCTSSGVLESRTTVLDWNGASDLRAISTIDCRSFKSTKRRFEQASAKGQT
jgi:hypothetical protein